ncbi:MAG: DUF4261 domain-containing protein [Verrucomicrobiota bacterium]
MEKHIFRIILVMGLFSFLGCSKVKGPPELEKPGKALSFVLLREPVLPEPAALQSAYEEFSGKTGSFRIMDEEESTDEEDTAVMVVNIDGIGTGFIALMPIAIPNGEAEAAFDYSMSSFREGASVEGHKAHILVTLMAEETTSPLDLMMAQTSLLAAVGKVTPSIGVYWGDAGATHTMDFFLAMASEKDVSPRATLWTGVSRAPEPGDRLSFLSLGMKQFALPDLYLISQPGEAGEALGRCYDLLAYVISRGEPIPEGDTIGADETEKIPVNYTKSPADNGEIVWKVEL